MWLTVDKNGKMYIWDIMNEWSEEFPPKSKTERNTDEEGKWGEDSAKTEVIEKKIYTLCEITQLWIVAISM